MRIAFLFFAAFLALPFSPLPASARLGITAPSQALGWIKGYRERPVPKAVPGFVRELASVGAFQEPEGAGVYVGFMAGVIASNPKTADALIAGMAKVPPADQWAVVKAVAYSRAPNWRTLLDHAARHMPTRAVMINAYLTGRLPAFDRYRMEEPKQSWMDRARGLFDRRKEEEDPYLEPSPALLDTFWGYYFATGSRKPLVDIAALAGWAKNGDDVAKLTLGSAAEYSLAANASRDLVLLAAVKDVRNTTVDPHLASVLDEAVFAAEVSETDKLRNDAADAITTLKTKGPAYLRKVKWWGQAGEGAIALGCVVAAATGQVYLGVPCVVGGAVTSATLHYLAREDS